MRLLAVVEVASPGECGWWTLLLWLMLMLLLLLLKVII